MKTVREAAESLLAKNEITQDEFSLLEKSGALRLPFTASEARRVAGVADNGTMASVKNAIKAFVDWKEIPKTKYLKNFTEGAPGMVDAAGNIVQHPTAATHLGEIPWAKTFANMSQASTLAAGTAGKAIMPAILTTAIASGAKEMFYDPIKQKRDIESSFGKIMEKTPALVGEDAEKIRDYFDVVKTFSPHAAGNPLVAGALVNKMIQFGGVDHKLVQDMASLQESRGSDGFMPLLMAGAAKSLSKVPKFGDDGDDK